MQRGDIRARYHIEGNGCTDCLAHFCCDCCVFSWKNLGADGLGFDSGGEGGADQGGCYDAGNERTELSLDCVLEIANNDIDYDGRVD